jgi:hypothetical protein
LDQFQHQQETVAVAVAVEPLDSHSVALQEVDLEEVQTVVVVVKDLKVSNLLHVMLLVTAVLKLEVTAEELSLVVVAVAVEKPFKVKELVQVPLVVLAVLEK